MVEIDIRGRAGGLFIRNAFMPMQDIIKALGLPGRPLAVDEVRDGVYRLVYHDGQEERSITFDSRFEPVEPDAAGGSSASTEPAEEAAADGDKASAKGDAEPAHR